MEKKTSFVKRVLILGLLTTTLSCGSSVEFTKSEFDTAKWKQDRNGCDNIRLTQLKNFRNVKGKLMDLTEREIRQTLGKPDQIELYKRKQKFYVYFLNRGGQCEENDDRKGQHIEIRFSALERVNEIAYRPETN